MFKEWLIQLLKGWIEKLSGQEWGPIPPEPPKPNLPEWVLEFGDLENLEPEYLFSKVPAFYVVMDVKAPVFFSDPNQSFTVERPDGTSALKHVFESRGDTLRAFKNGEIILGFKDKIPASVKVNEKAYSNGGPNIEVCKYKGGVVRPDDVKMVGWVEDGKYFEADYMGL